MDIRIEKTDRAIEKAFMELRARQPLEKIRIKDLCTLAKVNKSTFYAHYEDIYELSGRLENKLIHVILDCVPNVGLTAAHTEQLTRELFHAFVQNQEAVNILFSGARQGIFANCIEKGLRDRLAAKDPTFAADPDRGILLSQEPFSFKIHGNRFFLLFQFMAPALVNICSTCAASRLCSVASSRGSAASRAAASA